MIDAFLLPALLAGIALAMAAGPLGSFVVWRRMAYFGDATAHAAILGVAGALALDAPVIGGTALAAIAMALAVGALARRGQTTDSMLGVLSHSALAVGLVVAALSPGAEGDLTAWLFGDILAVGPGEVALIWAGAGAATGVVIWRWSNLLTVTLNADLAASAGIDIRREDLVLTLALAVVVALSIKIVGALLVAAMLIIPAAAARNLVRSPEAMAAAATLIALAAVGGGLWASLWLDTPAGPSIVSAAAAGFALSLAAGPLRRRAR